MSEIPYMMANTRAEFERVRDLAWPATDRPHLADATDPGDVCQECGWLDGVHDRACSNRPAPVMSRTARVAAPAPMTVVDLDALDKLRGELVEALGDTATGIFMGPGWGDNFAAILLPVVDRIANERAAAELRAAAEWLEGAGDGPAAPEWPEALPRADVAAMLHGRADEFGVPLCPDCESPFHGRPCSRADALDPQ